MLSQTGIDDLVVIQTVPKRKRIRRGNRIKDRVIDQRRSPDNTTKHDVLSAVRSSTRPRITGFHHIYFCI